MKLIIDIDEKWNSDTYEGMIFCHECIEKLLCKAESEE